MYHELMCALQVGTCFTKSIKDLPQPHTVNTYSHELIVALRRLESNGFRLTNNAASKREGRDEVCLT